MPINKSKKESIVKELKDAVVPALSSVFVNFHGLSVSESTTLRKNLKGAGVGLKVAKKTLFRRAFGESKVAGEMPELAGEVGVAYLADSTDTLAAPREVHNFAKAHAEHLQILGGVWEGKYASRELMLELATIPAREVLLAKLANLLNSPIQRFVMALDLIGKSKTA